MVSIKENILRMKDMSELMVDLAYSALLLHDQNITAEVESMYEELQKIGKDTLKLLFKIKESEEERIYMIELTDQIKEIADGARHIAELTREKAMPAIIKDILKETDERILVETVSVHSVLANKRVGESEVKKHTRAKIIAIKRKGRWLFGITRDTKILAGDTLVAVGSKFAEKPFKDAAGAL